MALRSIFGEPSVGVRSAEVEAWITVAGGQLAPVNFCLGDRNIQPFHVAPWHDEPGIEPPCIRALRGDFFCLPFGGNSEPYEGERHPIHGETANADWRVVDGDDSRVAMELNLTVRPGQVRKEIRLVPGHRAVYSRHTVSGMSGSMPVGHHAMLRFDSPGAVSVSPFALGQVFTGPFEDPATGGYTSLAPGARFDRLDAVPMANGQLADLTSYPSREGFEDLAMVYSVSNADFAWSTVTFPEEGYVWFSLKDPRQLSGTILWHSNGGRHYAPWNGRHRRVLGIEEVTANFHYGLAGSVGPSEARSEGFRTCLEFSPEAPTVVSTIMGVAEIPPGFDRVATIERQADGIRLTSSEGAWLHVPLDGKWLEGR